MNTSYTNAWALIITLITTSMTAMYSLRIIFFAFMGNPWFLPMVLISESTPTMINPIKRLAAGSIFAGYLMTNLISPLTTQQLTMPTSLKMAALVVTISGLALALELNNLTLNLTMKFSSTSHNFSNQLGFYPAIIHRLLPLKNLSTSQKMAFKSLDLIWLEYSLPKLLSYFNSLASSTTSDQKGMVKLYFLSFLLTLPLPLTMALF